LFGDDSQDWQEPELRHSLRRVAQNLEKLNAALALFVDGLDEYVGKPKELISLFQNIAGFPNIKMCVASRPWVEFEDAFTHKPSLMVQDLTYDDIKIFVTSKFHGEPMFAQLLQREEEFANKLIDEVVSKADGVFLWVALVVASLLSGMVFGDRVSDLKRRLDILPPDLENLYEKMLLSLDPFYLEHAAQLFSLVRASKGTLTLLTASFADEDDLDFALRREILPLTRDEVTLRMDTIRRRINSRCKGLLEIKGSAYVTVCNVNDPIVEYLHRTVKDYIEGDQARKFLQRATTSTNDPTLRCLAANVAYIKGLAPSEILSPTAVDLFIYCFNHGRLVQPSGIPRMVLLLDELKRILSTHSHGGAEAILRLVAGISSMSIQTFPETAENSLAHNSRAIGNTFLSFAVQCQNVEYIKARAPAGCIMQLPTSEQIIRGHRKWPLLRDALHSLNNHYHHDRSEILQLIQCLLDRGADPNFMEYTHEDNWVPFSPFLLLMTDILEYVFEQIFQAPVVVLGEGRAKNNDPSTQVLRLRAAQLFSRAKGLENVVIDNALTEAHRRVGYRMGIERVVRVQFSVVHLRGWNDLRRARRAFRNSLLKAEDVDVSMAEGLAERLIRLAFGFDYTFSV
jgi:hypothetical protein